MGHLTALNKDLTAENTKVYAELAASHALNTELVRAAGAVMTVVAGQRRS